MKLDYGAGSQPKRGFQTADYTGTSNYDFFIQNYKVINAKANSCDVIHCRNVIHHIPEKDLPRLFAEFKRLLKPDGTLIISEPRKEFHKQNLILDIIWYRFLVHDKNIMLPSHYVNYKKYLTAFQTIKTQNEYQNEILTLIQEQVYQNVV